MNTLNPYIFLKENHSPEYQLILDTAKSLSFSVPKKKERIAQNMFVVSLITSGVWSKLDELYLFAHSANVDFCTINFIHPSHQIIHNSLSYYKIKAGYVFTNGFQFLNTFNKKTNPWSKFKLGNASIISAWGHSQEDVTDGNFSPVLSLGDIDNEVRIREQAYRYYLQQGGGYYQLGTTRMRVRPNELRVITRTNDTVWGYYDNSLGFSRSISYTGTGSTSTSTDVDYTLRILHGGSSSANKIAQLVATGEHLTNIDVENFTNAWNQYLTDIEII